MPAHACDHLQTCFQRIKQQFEMLEMCVSIVSKYPAPSLGHITLKVPTGGPGGYGRSAVIRLHH